MKAAIYNIIDGKVRAFIDAPANHIAMQCQEGEEFYLNCPDNVTHIINDEPVTIIPEPIPPTEAELLTAVTMEVQQHLDATARSRNYDGILSLCTYATSTDTTFAAEGQAGVEWRDSCWRSCYQVLAAVKAGTRAIPTPQEMVLALPPMEWP